MTRPCTVGSASGSGAVDLASVYVRLKPKSGRDLSQQQLSERIRPELRRVAGVTAYPLEAGGPGGGMKPLQMQLQGPDAATLNRLADSAATRLKMRSSVPRGRDVITRSRRSSSAGRSC